MSCRDLQGFTWRRVQGVPRGNVLGSRGCEGRERLFAVPSGGMEREGSGKQRAVHALPSGLLRIVRGEDEMERGVLTVPTRDVERCCWRSFRGGV